MRVLVTGASGFLGRHVCEALRAAGHEVVPATRRGGAPGAGGVTIDFATAHDPAQWLPALRGIDAVVNAVGILREDRGRTFQALHVAAPCALFEACVRAGVRRVVQISALGADARATTGYHLSKRAADEHLLSLPLDGVVVQPSLVYGPGGASARLFGVWATLPVTPLPGRGRQGVQPLHVDDLAEAVLALLGRDLAMRGRIAFVGPEPLTLAAFLGALRAGFGRPPTLRLPVPMLLVRWAAAVGGRLPFGLLDRPTLSMLERGNTAPVDGIAALLRRRPRPVADFHATDRRAARDAVTLAWTLPLLRWSIGLVWIVTGVVSFGVYPVEDSLALLARLGLDGVLATGLLYGAALLDLTFGVATLMAVRPRWLWAAQGLLIAGYTVLITVGLPEFWLHPYGPILKNLPMLAALAMLDAFEERTRWNT